MSCQVWWARTGDVRAEHQALLSHPERQRLETYHRDDDRRRYVAGCAVARLVLGPRLGVAPAAVAIDRTCASCGEPHGPPRVAGGLELSVARTGDLVALAVCDRPVGIDVEEIEGSAGVVELAGPPVLSDAEAHALAALPHRARPGALVRYWTRKQAVLKATGDGLKVEPSAVTVTGPDAPPRLVGFAGRPGLEERAALLDLHPAPAHAAALCVLGAGDDLEVTEHDAGPLLRGYDAALGSSSSSSGP